MRIQTPQIFLTDLVKGALSDAVRRGMSFTDDAAAVERMGLAIKSVPGDEDNIKLTTPQDLDCGRDSETQEGSGMMRIGHGYDVHRLTEGRKLILGGVEIPYEKGLLGHSDADVLTHAVMDALLGAAGLGDIGRHFPDNDDRFLGADSLLLLKEVCRLLSVKGYRIGNVDVTVIAQRPKLMQFIPEMRRNLAGVMNVDEDAVNVKATTEEKLGFTGEGLGIAAHAVALIE